MTDDAEIAPDVPSPVRSVRRRSAKGKLIGWGALAVIVLVIVAIFAITRALTPTPPDPAVTAAAPETSAAAPPAPSQPPATASSEATAPAVTAAVAPPASAAASASSDPSGPTLAVIQPEIMDQASRKALLGTLIDQGVFTGIQAVGSPPKVGVTALFLGLAPDLQRQFLATVDSYVNNGAPAQVPLQVIDATTARTIGTFTTADGLKLL